ncbi:MAG TPA: nuclear transport factor 2 family protein [Pyrinomonadaceae bacterium]
MSARHVLFALLSLCVLAGAATAQTMAPAQPAQAASLAAAVVMVSGALTGAQRSAAEQFLELEQGWMDALARKDAAKLEATLAPEFTIVGVGSRADDMVSDRAGWPRLSGQRPWPRHEVKIIKVSKLDRTAVVHCVLTAEYPPRSITPKGGLITFLVTDTWVERGGRWQVLTRHASLPAERD